MDACDTLDILDLEPTLYGRLAHREALAARAARFAQLDTPLHPDLEARLLSRGVSALWSHQALAIDHLRRGEHVVIASGTASGKSLCYQLPIIDSVLNATSDTALLIFPTKALAHDQLQSMRSWLVPGLKAVTYDGDTAPDDRTWARRNANVILTNPEMLHMGILPSHDRWATFLMRLRWVVVDELHALRGIFGSHVAHILRRLQRLCEKYRSQPTFCFASATIGNPAELASALCAQPVIAITDDGSPRAERQLALWQRPLLDPHTGTRTSANAETAMLLQRFVRDGHQSLAFCRSRRGAELVAQRTREVLRDEEPALVDRVAAYRGGYLADERRSLEQAFGNGDLLGVAATNALELGIDIGGLDAVVLNGFPGTLASMWQQAGRAGRSGRRSCAVLVAGDDQLDQWYAAHPRELVSRSPEHAVINPDNPFVMRAQVGCAAHELPLQPSDERWFGSGLDSAVVDLVRTDQLRSRGAKLYWAGNEPPAPNVGLRTGTNAEYQLIDAAADDTIGTVDEARVHAVAHPGAVYLHQGRQFRVRSLDSDRRVALVDEYDEDEFTLPRSDSAIEISEVEADAPMGSGSRVYLGSVVVTTTVVAYQRKQASSGRSIEVVALDLPTRALDTRACWYTVPLQRLAMAGVEGAAVLGAVHAAEHGLIGLLPLFTICDRWDVGGVSMAAHPQTGEPTIFVYDGYPGGAGIAEMAYGARDRHAGETLSLLRDCRCDSGCPSCVQSPKCGNWNEYLDKGAAIRLLEVVTDLSASSR